jgi:peroxiredoxin (alkyl hydroperoxide reductase subunit C)
MAADPTGKLARVFGVYLEDAGVPLRGTFLVSPDGVLVNAEVNFLNLGRNVDELMRKFKANLYLSRKPAEGCPAQWKEEGDVTLKPSARMVGKVHEALAHDGEAD